MLKTIEEEWDGFAAMAIPHISKQHIQYIEMKKAFFAGAWSVHSAVVEIGEPHISEQDGIDYLETITEEFKEFRAKLEREYGEMKTPIDRLRRCKLFGGNETELRKNQVVRDYIAMERRAKQLMDQVMKTWSPPLLTGKVHPADIAQTSTMNAIAYIMGKDFMPSELTVNQRASIDTGQELFHKVLGQ